MIFDEISDIKDIMNKDNDELEELLQIKRDSLNESQAKRTRDSNDVDPDPNEEVNEDVEPEEGLGLFDNAEVEDAIQLENEDSKNKEEEADQP